VAVLHTVYEENTEEFNKKELKKRILLFIKDFIFTARGSNG